MLLEKMAKFKKGKKKKDATYKILRRLVLLKGETNLNLH